METPTGALVTAPAEKRSTGIAHINGKIKAAIVFRYKLPVSAKDIKPNEEIKEFIGEFMFFGDHGKILIGHDAELVVATTRGKARDLPPVVQNVVGTKCLVTACVTQEAYEADNITSADRCLQQAPQKLLCVKKKLRHLPHLTKYQWNRRYKRFRLPAERKDYRKMLKPTSRASALHLKKKEDQTS